MWHLPFTVHTRQPNRELAARMIADGYTGPCPTMFQSDTSGWVECDQQVGHTGPCSCV